MFWCCSTFVCVTGMQQKLHYAAERLKHPQRKVLRVHELTEVKRVEDDERGEQMIREGGVGKPWIGKRIRKSLGAQLAHQRV